MNEKNFGEKLKSLRKQNGFKIDTIKELLEKRNIPISTKAIYKWENNESIPDIQIINALSSIYNVNINALFDITSSCQALDEGELEFIDTLRTNDDYKKIIWILTKKDKEEVKNGNKTIY